ncbi:DUF397 domain-containing protein [Streptomyces sp. H27-H1]|uniref:DUF397 domain-containing protein n=1 Tax=Streptomyces sp. H27-H1 TaxID=2996461 RepID=UPI002D1E3987|nr:DUF397 domain-containing protein [Streptomyces sp. H27-H1]
MHDDLSAVSWRTSSYSTAPEGLCVEVADGIPGLVPVRDSKVEDGPVLVLSATAWAGFITGLKSH